MFGDFFKKKSPRVFTHHWATRKQPEFKSSMYKVKKKLKCSKIPQGVKVLVSGPWTIKTQV